jgi:Fur family transcriptional regulator, ferric uptake regulator
MSLRSTRQRAAVINALSNAEEFVSAQQLHSELRVRGEAVGLSTVYRTLQALAAATEIDILIGDDGETRYRSCSDGHHHHLVCSKCGATVEVENREVEAWAAKIAKEHGYLAVSHTLEIYGLCPACTVGQR